MKSWSKTVIAAGFFRCLTTKAQCKLANKGKIKGRFITDFASIYGVMLALGGDNGRRASLVDR
jgi:hypothetical protein